jgi:hypothetical protein
MIFIIVPAGKFLRESNDFCEFAEISRDELTMTDTVPSARLTLHSTKLSTKFKIFRKFLFWHEGYL